MNIEYVRNVTERHNYAPIHPCRKTLLEFKKDIDEGDKYELGRTWRRNWELELQATFDHSDQIYTISSNDHEGIAVFGLTAANDHSAQMWLIQSKTFAASAQNFHGRRWPIKASKMAREMIELSLLHYPIVFNFIPKSQTRNIRWLKNSGFTFYEHPTHPTDIFFFCAGKSAEKIAKNPRFWSSFVG